MKTIAGSLLIFFIFIHSITLLAQKDQQPIQLYWKYDFIPREKVIFFDDFSSKNIGDFPVQWNTDGSYFTTIFILRKGNTRWTLPA